jgi:hypothetical protein
LTWAGLCLLPENPAREGLLPALFCLFGTLKRRQNGAHSSFQAHTAFPLRQAASQA